MKTNHTAHQTNPTEEVGEHLVEDAQALLGATAHVAEEKVVKARKRLTAALEKGGATWNIIREKAVAGAKATDQVIREHPYQSIGVALGIGALIGLLRRRAEHRVPASRRQSLRHPRSHRHLIYSGEQAGGSICGNRAHPRFLPGLRGDTNAGIGVRYWF